MAVHLYCPICYTSNRLDAKECSSCKKPFGRDRRYRVAISVKGRRFTLVVDNLTIAQELESTIKSDMVREQFDITHHKAKITATLNDLWAKYLPCAKEHKKPWDDDFFHYRKHLEPRFGNKALDSITSFDVEKLKSDLKKGLNTHGKPYRPATIKDQLVLLRHLYNMARKWGIYDGKNPMDSVQRTKVDNQVTQLLTDEELSRLLEVLENWPFRESAAFVKFAMVTGVSCGELFKLQWEHVDFERQMVKLIDPKGNRTTTIPVSPQALDVLAALNRDSVYVFPGDDGKQRTDVKGPWLRIRKTAGLPPGFRFHGLRHHFASTLVSNGVDLSIVGALLTHKNI